MDKGGSTKCNLLSRLLLKLGPNFFLICYVKTDLSPRTWTEIIPPFLTRENPKKPLPKNRPWYPPGPYSGASDNLPPQHWCSKSKPLGPLGRSSPAGLGGAVRPAEEETLPEVAKRHNFGRRQAPPSRGAAAVTPLLTARGRSWPYARRAEGRGRRREELPDRLLLLLLLFFVLFVLCDRSAAVILTFRGPTSW